jgi:hypothetical protein
MGDYPTQLANPVPAAISPGYLFPEICNVGSYGSRSWGVANTAIFVPFSVEEYVTAYKISDVGGNTPAGNADGGIYNLDGTRIVSSGSTAQGSVGVLTILDIADTLLKPGYYLFAVASSGGDHFASNGRGATYDQYGIRSMASAFPLPATVTLAPAINYLPSVALHFKSVV